MSFLGDLVHTAEHTFNDVVEPEIVKIGKAVADTTKNELQTAASTIGHAATSVAHTVQDIIDHGVLKAETVMHHIPAIVAEVQKNLPAGIVATGPASVEGLDDIAIHVQAKPEGFIGPFPFPTPFPFPL
jgi:maleate cis-trans isomerase